MARAAITRTFNLWGIGSRSGTPAAIAPSSRSTGRRRSTNAPSAIAGVHAGLAALGRPREAEPLGPPLSLAVHNRAVTNTTKADRFGYRFQDACRDLPCQRR